MKKQFSLLLLMLTLSVAFAQRPFPVGLPSCLEDDFRELEKLYDASNGGSWTNKTNWFTNPNMATWYGITLATSGCDVVSISLNRNNLTGTLYNLNLPNLTFLSLNNNFLSGNIPSFSCPELRNLGLDYNQFTGNIPNFNCPKMTGLYLHFNQLSGVIPNFNMPNITYLWLQRNQLSGVIPNFNMPSMTNFDLSSNQLTGSIPNFNMPKLGGLALQQNQFTGGAPNFNFPLLTYIDISDNPNLGGNVPNLTSSTNLQTYYAVRSGLIGSIPNFSQANLRALLLYSNQLTGNIPNFNLPNLTQLDLSRNQLTGSIPSFTMPNLTNLDLRNNKFIFGDIIGKNWLSITTLAYTDQAKIPINFNSGTLSVSTGEPDNTQQFQWYKDGNLIATTQSSQYQPTASGTYYCKIRHNTLTVATNANKNLVLQSEDYAFNFCGASSNPSVFSITTAAATVSWGAISGSSYVVEYKTALSTVWTALPSTTNTSLTLTGLTVATDYNVRVTSDCNNIPFGTSNFTTLSNGTYPFPIGLPTCLEEDFRELEKLYIATNGNSWTNKTNWFTNPNMATWYGVSLTSSGCDVVLINLGVNNLVGTLPNLNLPLLEILSVAGNQLTGNIPNYVMPNLKTLFLRANQLSGNIPNFITPNLDYLDVGINQLTGTVPNFNMPNLTYLDFSKNQLTGGIPNFAFPLLSRFYLNENKFIFEDMIGKNWLNIATLFYAPQSKISINFNSGTLSVSTGEPDNTRQFQWYKDGNLIATTQSSQYQPTASGTYYCKIRHNTLTVATNANKNLILQSEDYILSVLPVELLTFTANPLRRTIQLNWQAATEKYASHFNVEKSKDGSTFNKMGQLKAHGNSVTLQDYAFMDEAPFNGVNYYRLRQVDFDGTATLSNIVSVTFNANQKLQVFPNPAKDKLIIISESVSEYSIIDVLGREILRGSFGDNQTDVSLSNMPTGVYFVKTKLESVKFVKQ